MIAGLSRRLGLLERGLPWLAAGALVGAVLVAAARLAAGGQLDAVLGQDAADHALRGHTPFGLFLGVAAVLLSLVAASYSLRKRALQERLASGGGTMATWLWLHVAAGVLALVATLAHAGYGLISAELTTGKILLGVFALLALSGVGWRVVYQVLPPIAAARVGDYSELASALRAEERLTEIEKLAAGGSTELHRLEAWILEAERAPAEVTRSAAALALPEQRALAEIHRLAGSRRRALAAGLAKAKYTRLLQAWRLAHIPLTLVFLPALVVHVLGALDLPARAMPAGGSPIQALSGFHRSKECASCHRAIVEQWSSSMHAHALTSPVMIAQNNQVLAAELGALPAPDPRRFCVNCHGPVSVALSGRSRLPLTRSGYDDRLLEEGIGCSACHQFRGASERGMGGLGKFQDGLRPGSKYFGELDDPVGNAFHRSGPAGVVKRDGGLCVNCHDVLYDRNGDGRIDRGVDLVLQTTQDEFDAYAAGGGKGTCVSCHMPVIAGQPRAAERAWLVTEQDGEAPPREVHDHSFVGVDYPLDEVAARDPQRPARDALLRGAARLELEPAAVKAGVLTLPVTITNAGVGHNLPSGFAFARQMWLEIRATGDGGKLVFESGVIAHTSDDLCDAGTLDEPQSPARPFLRGCKASDPQLVNFQQKLFDRVDVERDAAGPPKLDARGEQKPVAASGAKESWLQHLSSGALPRVRPVDGAVLAPITPGEARRFVYRVPTAGQARLTVTVRLLFRSLAPYMIRALGAGQPADERPALGPLVENLQVVEMAARAVALDVAGK
jgi:hypothetical protein